jgi:S-adenosyl-L-methionine hydrolase (adenosine-forming)
LFCAVSTTPAASAARLYRAALMARSYTHVSFLSDLGRGDDHVGVVHAVLADLAPHATVIDLTHEIAPYDTRAGSLALARAIAYLPDGIVIAAVDAAGSRPAVAVEVAGGKGVFLAPDNGIMAAAVALAGGAERAVLLLPDGPTAFASPGSTLIVRDIFAPAAAHLCNGGAFSDLGPEVSIEALLPGVVPIAREEDGAVAAEVVWVDRFGNAQLNIGPDDLAGWPDAVRLRFNDDVRHAKVTVGFADLPAGVSLTLDGHGMYAIVLARHSAAAELGIGVGTAVRLEPATGDGADSAGVSAPVSLRARPDR